MHRGKTGLEQTYVIPRAVNDAVHVDGLAFNRVEDEVVFDDEILITETGKLFFLGYPTEARVASQQLDVLFDLRCDGLGSGGTIGSDVGDNFCEIVFSDAHETNRVLTPLHGSVCGGPSLPERVSDPCRRLSAGLVQPRACRRDRA